MVSDKELVNNLQFWRKTMTFEIFDKSKKVEIKDDLIALYEQKVAPIDYHRIEYLIASSNADVSSDNLDAIVEQSIIEEIAMYERIPHIIKEIQSA